MQRYFVDRKQITNHSIIITNHDDIHHISKVMRFCTGTELICVDGLGNDYVAKITQITKNEVTCDIIKIHPSQGEPLTKIILAQSLPKGERWNWVLQKGTELGVTQFLPFISERTVVKIDEKKAEKKRDRWQRIVKEAAEQSARGIIPEVSSPRTWKDLLSVIKEQAHAWIAYENGGKPLNACLQPLEGKQAILLIVGPEGGFSATEIEEAVQAGATPITLGSRILRTETASLVALSCVLYSMNELGGESRE